MERRLLQLQNESSEQIRQLSDEITHLQEDKMYLEERSKIAISSMAPLRSMSSSSSPPSLYSLSHEPDSKHRDHRRGGGGTSSPNSPSHSENRECCREVFSSCNFGAGAPCSFGRSKFETGRLPLLKMLRRRSLPQTPPKWTRQQHENRL